MTDTVYTDTITLLTADTMNDLNRLQYTIFADPADVTAVKTTLHAAPGAIGGTTPAAISATTITASGLISANAGLTAPSGQVIRGNTATGNTTGAAIVGVASTVGTGVHGDSNSGYGAYFQSSSGDALYAYSLTGRAILAIAEGNYAIHAQGDVTSPVTAAFRLVPQNAQPTGPNSIGDVYVTSAGVLKICTVAGAPGTWVSVGAQV